MFEAPSYKEEVTLDGRPYLLSFHWNTRGEYWSMAIADRDEVMLLSGIRLVMLFPLIHYRHVDSRLPPGELIVMDTSANTIYQEPGRYDFSNNRCSLYYVSENE